MSLKQLRSLIRFAFEKLPPDKIWDFVLKHLKSYIEEIDEKENLDKKR